MVIELEIWFKNCDVRDIIEWNCKWKKNFGKIKVLIFVESLIMKCYDISRGCFIFMCFIICFYGLNINSDIIMYVKKVWKV